MARYLLIILPWVCTLFPLFAQETAIEWATTYYRQGETALLEKKYKQAQRLFAKALEMDSNFTAAHRLLGACYELTNDPANAVNHYQRVLALDSMFSRALYYQLGESFYKTGRYPEAIAYFEKYQALQAYPPDRFGLNGPREMRQEAAYLQKLSGNIKACQVAMDSVKFLNVTEVINLGGNINSNADEVFPALTNDQQVLYFTRLRGTDDDENLLVSTTNADGRWTAARPLRGFNTRDPEGYASLMRDGRRLFFTACRRPNVDGPCDIWEALVKDEEVLEMQTLKGLVNSDKWESQAAISCDGNTLYFASIREGGLGGSDIWKSERLPTGGWGRPVNLGPKINTPQDEEAPYITNDGKTLYFSSTGHLGMGEQDIFMSWQDYHSGQWSTPINLGPPVNSAYRELGFFLSADGRTGYFSSDRPDGSGGMDIYRFALSDKLYSDPITFVEGFVRDSVLLTPVNGAKVSINGRNPQLTDAEGRFFLCAGADEVLDFRLGEKLYKPYHNQFVIPEWNNRVFYTLELLLQPTISFLTGEITAKGAPADPAPSTDRRTEHKYQFAVLFSFDDDKLTPQELDRLGEFVESLKGKEVTKAEILGFADDIGTDVYNLRLSEERAKAVALFLVENGIMIDQIYMEGRGEIRNADPKALNRRVEIRVTTLE